MKVASGKGRRPYRIKEWMAGEGLTLSRVAADLGVSTSLVGHTIYGRKNHRRVLRYLKDAGCPQNILSLPEDLEKNGQEAA